MKEKGIESFENWLKTPNGKQTLKSMQMLVKPENQKYFQNCMFWAFNDGQRWHDVQFSSTVGEVLREVLSLGRKRVVRKHIICQIEYILKENEKR